MASKQILLSINEQQNKVSPNQHHNLPSLVLDPLHFIYKLTWFECSFTFNDVKILRGSACPVSAAWASSLPRTATEVTRVHVCHATATPALASRVSESFHIMLHIHTTLYTLQCSTLLLGRYDVYCIVAEIQRLIV